MFRVEISEMPLSGFIQGSMLSSPDWQALSAPTLGTQHTYTTKCQ